MSLRNTDNEFEFGLNYNFGVENPMTAQYQRIASITPVSGDFNLLDGSDFLLLDGTSFLLL